MSDQQLLDRIALTDPCAADAGLPEGAWDAEATLARTERLAGGPEPRTRRSGAFVAAAAFVAVLIVGFGLAFVLWTTPEEPPVTDTTVPPTVTTSLPPESVAPSTIAPQPVSAEAESLLAEFFSALDQGDVSDAIAVVADDAAVDFAPWIEQGRDPRLRNVADRVESYEAFEDGFDLLSCAQTADGIACEVARTDFFSEHMELEPWAETWVFQTDGQLITSIDVRVPGPERVEPMTEFSAWVGERGVGPLLAADAEWVRTAENLLGMRSELVEYGALASGVEPDVWAVIDEFFVTVSDADIPAALDLFSTIGVYETYETQRSVFNAPWVEWSGPVTSANVREQFVFWYEMLHHDWRPTRCTGDALEVRCQTLESGLSYLGRSGFAVQGLVVFTFDGTQIAKLDDFVLRGGDVREFWQDWVSLNAPEYHFVWVDPSGIGTGGVGNGSVPRTQVVADATLELYPRWLADQGVDVPPEFLDGSLLSDDWVSLADA